MVGTEVNALKIWGKGVKNNIDELELRKNVKKYLFEWQKTSNNLNFYDRPVRISSNEMKNEIAT